MSKKPSVNKKAPAKKKAKKTDRELKQGYYLPLLREYFNSGYNEVFNKLIYSVAFTSVYFIMKTINNKRLPVDLRCYYFFLLERARQQSELVYLDPNRLCWLMKIETVKKRREWQIMFSQYIRKTEDLYLHGDIQLQDLPEDPVVISNYRQDSRFKVVSFPPIILMQMPRQYRYDLKLKDKIIPEISESFMGMLGISELAQGDFKSKSIIPEIVTGIKKFPDIKMDSLMRDETMGVNRQGAEKTVMPIKELYSEDEPAGLAESGSTRYRNKEESDTGKGITVIPEEETSKKEDVAVETEKKEVPDDIKEDLPEIKEDAVVKAENTENNQNSVPIEGKEPLLEDNPVKEKGVVEDDKPENDKDEKGKESVNDKLLLDLTATMKSIQESLLGINKKIEDKNTVDTVADINQSVEIKEDDAEFECEQCSATVSIKDKQCPVCGSVFE